MKRKIIVTVVILLLLGVGWWYYDVGSWKEVPSMELLYQYSSGYPFRTESNKKFDPDFYTWYSYFGPEDFRTPDHKAIYDACQKLYGFDFDQYTYILSYGFTIEKLLYKGNYGEPKFCCIVFPRLILCLARIAEIHMLTNLYRISALYA